MCTQSYSYAQIDALQQKGTAMKILCIGDSNTYGYDPGYCFGGRYPARIRWTDRLAGHTVINSGLNGMSVPPAATDFVGLIKSTAPDLVTVMLGVNDLLQGADADRTASRMEAFLTELKEASAPVKARVLLIAPPPVQHGEWVTSSRIIEESKKLAKLYRSVAQHTGVCFADAGAWNIALTYDGVHFSEAGHASFARGLEHALNQIEASL